MKCSVPHCSREVEDAQFKTCRHCRERSRAYDKKHPGRLHKYYQKNRDERLVYQKGYAILHKSFQREGVCSNCHTREVEDIGYKTCRACRESTYRWRDTKRRQQELLNLDLDCALSRAYFNGEVSGKDDWQLLQDTDRALQEVRQKIADDPYSRSLDLPPEFQAAAIYARRISASQYRLPYDLTPDERAAMFEAQGGCCYLCGELLYGRLNDPPSIEHKLPVSRGGTNALFNLALAHLSCNRKKHTKTPEEFFASTECLNSRK